jgi:hypothetical protein
MEVDDEQSVAVDMVILEARLLPIRYIYHPLTVCLGIHMRSGNKQ